MARPKLYYIALEAGTARIIVGSIAARRCYASGGFKTQLDAEEAACWRQYDIDKFTYKPYVKPHMRRVRTEWFKPGAPEPFLSY